MRRIIIATAVVCWLIAGIAWGAGQRAGTVTLEVDLSAQAPGIEAKLWIPYPVSDQNQTVDDIKVAGHIQIHRRCLGRYRQGKGEQGEDDEGQDGFLHGFLLGKQFMVDGDLPVSGRYELSILYWAPLLSP
jgi:hypothetical protein